MRRLVWRPPAAPEVCCSSHANSNDPHASGSWYGAAAHRRLARDSSAAAPICEYIGSPHHRSVCGRCVRDFSHHCGFFGRCITRGNLPYFRTIITIGHLSGVTFAVVLASSIAHSWANGSFATILPVALALWMSYFVANGGGGMLVTMCRFAVLGHCPAAIARRRSDENAARADARRRARPVDVENAGSVLDRGFGRVCKYLRAHHAPPVRALPSRTLTDLASLRHLLWASATLSVSFDSWPTSPSATLALTCCGFLSYCSR